MDACDTAQQVINDKSSDSQSGFKKNPDLTGYVLPTINPDTGFFYTAVVNSQSLVHGPPVPLYLLNCVFLN